MGDRSRHRNSNSSDSRPKSTAPINLIIIMMVMAIAAKIMVIITCRTVVVVLIEYNFRVSQLVGQLVSGLFLNLSPFLPQQYYLLSIAHPITLTG